MSSCLPIKLQPPAWPDLGTNFHGDDDARDTTRTRKLSGVPCGEQGTKADLCGQGGCQARASRFNVLASLVGNCPMGVKADATSRYPRGCADARQRLQRICKVQHQLGTNPVACSGNWGRPTSHLQPAHPWKEDKAEKGKKCNSKEHR